MAYSAWAASMSGLLSRARQVARIWASTLPAGGGEGSAPRGQDPLTAGW